MPCRHLGDSLVEVVERGVAGFQVQIEGRLIVSLAAENENLVAGIGPDTVERFELLKGSLSFIGLNQTRKGG